MHGVIFVELQKYVTARLGPDAWSALLREAGVSTSIFLPVLEYPDTDAVALVSKAAASTGRTVEQILEDFGEFIVPDLVKMYGAFIKPEWKTLELLENTEATIHRVVRSRNPGARPPELKVERVNKKEVVITYASERKMCALAKGIISGVAKAYGETVHVSEAQCMLRGAAACLIAVRRSEKRS